MKTGIFLAALVQLAAAQPHRNRHAHLHERAMDVVTQVDVVTATAPNVVVFVNEAGVPVSTSYGAGAKQAAATPAAVAVSSVVVPAKVPATEATSVPAKAAAAPAASSPLVQAAAAPATGGYGITYSPYNADGSCKSQDEVNSDFDKITGYSMVRIYGVDCEQVTTVGNAAIAKGMKLFLGVYDPSAVASEIGTMTAAMSGKWEHVDTVSIGNEVVNSGGSPSEVVSAIAAARPLLKAAGYSGPVVTVDTFVAMIANPELCNASDYAAANCHAFFDSDMTAAGAGAYVLSQANLVKAACGGVKTVITESGWPTSGSANGAAVPGTAEQAAAISSLKSSFSDNLILYTAFDDMWKTANAATFDAEQFWGMIPGQ